MRRRSLAGRVILLTTLAVGLAVALVSAGAYLTARSQLQATLDDSLRNRAEQASNSALLPLARDYELPSWALGAADVRIGYITPTQAYTADTGPPLQLGEPELNVALGRDDSSIRTVEAGGIDYRVVAVPSRRGEALVIAQSLEPQQQTLARLGVVLLVVGLTGVAVAAVAGWLVARSGLRPVRRLTRSVEEIARTEDLTPLPVEGGDEIARLAGAFNTMLAALDASREHQRRLVADAGHELRTPLTSLRTNIDLLTQSAAAGNQGSPGLSAETHADLLDDVRAQIEELTTLIGDLVELARDDVQAPVLEPIDLADVVDAAVARVRRRAPGVELEVSTTPWWLIGDATALERAVTNLLDNAVKWSPEGEVVHCDLAGGALTVDDAGPGIAEGDRPHVFDRFWRATESRSMPGSGLGLAIVAQAVERHAGTIDVAESPRGGARFVVRLPGAGGPPPDEPGEQPGRSSRIADTPAVVAGSSHA